MINALVRAKGQVTIPNDIRKRFGIEEGDLVEFTEVDGQLVLVPSTNVVVPKDQAWFWSPEWQSSFRSGMEDLATGNLDRSDNEDDFLASLN